jgi:hypothetical protein
VEFVLPLQEIDQCRRTFLFSNSFFCASLMSLEHCVIAAVVCNWYLHDINLCSLSKKIYLLFLLSMLLIPMKHSSTPSPSTRRSHLFFSAPFFIRGRSLHAFSVVTRRHKTWEERTISAEVVLASAENAAHNFLTSIDGA